MCSKLFHHHSLAAALTLIAVAGLPASWSAERTWIGPSGGDWFNPGHWDPAGVPEATDTIHLNGSPALSAPITIGGTLNWTGGMLGPGTFTVAPGGVLNITGPEEKAMLSLELRNRGTVNWSGSGGLTAYAQAADQAVKLVNEPGAVWEVTASGSLAESSRFGWLPALSFENAGQLIKKENTSSFVLSAGLINHGLIDLQSGGLLINGPNNSTGQWRVGAGVTLRFVAGATVFESGAVLDLLGSGALHLAGADVLFKTGSALNGGPEALVQYQAGSMTFEPGVAVAATTVNQIVGAVVWNGPLDLPNLQLSGSGYLMGNLTNAGVLNWTGGMLGPGTFTVAPGGVLNITGPEEKAMLSLELRNRGTVNWSGSGGLTAYANGPDQAVKLVNEPGAVWEVTATGSLSWSSRFGWVPAFSFENAGQLIKKESGSTTTFTLSAGLFNQGAIQLETGTLRVSGEYTGSPTGTLLFGLGGTVAGSEYGRFVVDGTAMVGDRIDAFLVGRFAPDIGTTFRVIGAPRLAGETANLYAADLDHHLFYRVIAGNQGVDLVTGSTRNERPPMLLTPLGARSGQFHLLLTGDPGLTYTLEASPDLVAWTPVLTTNAPSETFELQDPGAAGAASRFYRASRAP